MLDYFGFHYSRVEGVQSMPHDNVAEAHFNAIESLDGQGIVLEDDCIPYNYRSHIDIPDDADIVYLGIHGHKFGNLERVSPDMWRIGWSLSSHAILYLTEKGKGLAKEAISLEREGSGGGFDYQLANLLYKTNTYALHSPLWYQRDCPELTALNVGDKRSFGVYGGGSNDYPVAYHPIYEPYPHIRY